MSDALSTILTFLPLFFLIWLANMADGRREHQHAEGDRGKIRSTSRSTSVLSRLVMGLTSGLFALIVLGGIALQLGAGWLQQALVSGELLGGAGPDLTSPMAAQLIDSLPQIGLGLWLTGLVGVGIIQRPVRRLIARLIPIDPDRLVHAMALAFAVLLVINLVLTLGVGLDTITEMLVLQAEAGESLSVSQAIIALWSQQGATALLALLGIGWLTRRSTAQSFARLGLVRPTLLQSFLGFGTGLSLVFVVGILGGLGAVIGFAPDPEVESLTTELIGPLLSTIPGILTIGLAAAIGEETIFRGALQPRFGLLLTALLFALTHSNYGLSFSTLVVFTVGIGFGLLRRQYNTTTAMIAHASYNTTIGLLGLLLVRFGEQLGA